MHIEQFCRDTYEQIKKNIPSAGDGLKKCKIFGGNTGVADDTEGCKDKTEPTKAGPKPPAPKPNPKPPAPKPVPEQSAPEPSTSSSEHIPKSSEDGSGGDDSTVESGDPGGDNYVGGGKPQHYGDGMEEESKCTTLVSLKLSLALSCIIQNII